MAVFNADAPDEEYNEYDTGEVAANELVEVNPNMPPENETSEAVANELVDVDPNMPPKYDAAEANAYELVDVDPSMPVENGTGEACALELVEVDPIMPPETAAIDLGIIDDPPVENAYMEFLEIEYLDADAFAAEEEVIKNEPFNFDLAQLSASIDEAAKNESNASDCFIVEE